MSRIYSNVFSYLKQWNTSEFGRAVRHLSIVGYGSAGALYGLSESFNKGFVGIDVITHSSVYGFAGAIFGGLYGATAPVAIPLTACVHAYRSLK